MKANDLLGHFLSRADWVDADNTVDRVIIGDTERDFDACCVTWMPELEALRRMKSLGIFLMVCHEPTFWSHPDKIPCDDSASMEKLNFIRDSGITIIRNHDCWDRWPEIGIPWAWAKFLGMENPPAIIAYDIAVVSLDELASSIAERCASVGEPAVQVVGDGKAKVSRIGIGTGCCCKIDAFLEMGCDCSVVCDDGSCYWERIQKAKESGHPVIRVNHGTSEEPGMTALAQYVNENIHGMRAVHIPHGCSFRLST
jgi:putative NIF3 family GTP cyclohydrolase 1 type 2